MEENKLLRVALRQGAIFIPDANVSDAKVALNPETAALIANLAQLGYGLEESLVQALNSTSDDFQKMLLETFRDVMGIGKNWTPLVKNWLIPTGESVLDHILTFFANVFQGPGTRLACGHIIPPGTFPLERYNGCPFCGTPFQVGEIEIIGQGSKMKILRLWTEKNAAQFFRDLLTSKTALDATQVDSLKILLQVLELPKADVGMKETMMLLIDQMIELDQAEKAQALFKSPTDILRYLWFKHTGFLQLIQPKTVVKRKSSNRTHRNPTQDESVLGKIEAAYQIQLKYRRAECLRVAKWLNALQMPNAAIAEMMHPKREMWVRFIRALRLAEYSKRPGFEKLRALLDIFYREDYPVWHGGVDHFRLRKDAAATMKLLQQRPGLFARSLFANMLWFGPQTVLAAFEEIVDQVPARLVFTLQMYAEIYFNRIGLRAVKPLGGTAKMIPKHHHLAQYSDQELHAMKMGIADLCLLAMRKRFAAQNNPNQSLYIDPQLFKMPVAIGDRSEQIQDMPVALMGSRFPIEGNQVRLFLQWGTGLPAQHLDMDLSCHIAYDNRSEVCAYFSLAPVGCKHSGDIRSIPNQIGTAEFIELEIDTLEKAGARYITFTCNAFSRGELTPNLVVGWMNSKNPMTVSETTGVAYDPSCVQHQVRITQGLTKGLVFGILEMASKEIIWLEMSFAGQTVHSMNMQSVMALLNKLNSKLSIGNLLKIKAESQGLSILQSAEGADEVYDLDWAMNAAKVTQLLVD